MLKKIIVFLLGLIVTYGLVLHTDNNEQERFFVAVRLNENKTAEKTIDISQYGQLKYYLNPNILSVYLRLDNKKAKYEHLTYRLSGVQAYVSQGSKKSVWEPVMQGEPLTLVRKGSLPLNLELNIPVADTKKYNVAKGELTIYEREQPVAVVRLNIINSKGKDDV